MMSDGFTSEDVSVYIGKQDTEHYYKGMHFKNPFQDMTKLWITGDGAEHIWGKVVTLLHFGSGDETKMIGGVFELLNHPLDDRYVYGDWVACEYVEHEGLDRLEGFVTFAKIPQSWKQPFLDYTKGVQGETPPA